MKLLALDTATEACSVAVIVDDQLYGCFELTPRAHAQMILPMIDDVLDEAGIGKGDIDVLAFGRGPGSFTGVRVAASTAQGIAFGLTCPVIPVSDLAALALQAHRFYQAEHILVAIDARMKEVYWGEFEIKDGLPVLLGEEQVAPPDQVPLVSSAAQYVGIGSGWGSYREAFDERLGDCVANVYGTALPRAQEIALLASHEFEAGRVLPADQAIPVYLRDNVAKKKGEQ
jgi:tRNA threonylcarbamoyladenosine biosynthesis protein TsaB